MRRCAALALMIWVALSCLPSSPKHEMRGAWIATVYGIDWPSVTGTTTDVTARQQEELDRLLDGLKEAGFNAVFFQVRPMADALYRSSLEPHSGFVSGRRGVSSAYDPLDYCIEAAHGRGMECHAWINPFRVGKTQPSTAHDLRHSHLWMTGKVGNSTMTIFNPAREGSVQHLIDICMEIADNYDIDGIVFDDYFYNPEFLPEDESAPDWDDYIEAHTPMTMADWRRGNINRAMQRVYHELQTVKSGKLRFGISPQGIAGGNGAHDDAGVPRPTEYGVITADSQYDKIYCDPVAWLRGGYVDYVSPQIYWPTTNPRHPYEGLARWWNDVAEQFGRHCFASINAAALAKDNSAEMCSELLREVDINREAAFNEAPGSVLYSATYVAGSKRCGLEQMLRDSLYTTTALMPPMRWKEAPALSVRDLRAKDGKLQWTPTSDSRYVVYAIPADIDLMDALSPTAEGLDARFIVGITYRPQFTLPSDLIKTHRIAVTPYDRYGNEWDATFLEQHR